MGKTLVIVGLAIAGIERWRSAWHAVLLNFSLSTGDASYNRTSSIAHPVSTRKS